MLDTQNKMQGVPHRIFDPGPKGPSVCVFDERGSVGSEGVRLGWIPFQY